MDEKHIKYIVENQDNDICHELAEHIPEFDFSKSPLLWRDNSTLKTSFENTLSIFLPILENFMVTVLQEAKDKIYDPKLKLELDMFCRQETNHANAHSKFNQFLESHDINVEQYANVVKKSASLYMAKSFKEKLIVTGFAETITSLLSEAILLYYPIENNDPEIQKMYIWHAVEELEHRCVAFDVLQAVYPKEKHYLIIAIFTLRLMRDLSWVTLKMIWDKGWFRYAKTYTDIFWLLGPKGPIYMMLKGYYSFTFKKNYHPRDFSPRISILTKIVQDWEVKFHNLKKDSK